jgi:hypothetical protein
LCQASLLQRQTRPGRNSKRQTQSGSISFDNFQGTSNNFQETTNNFQGTNNNFQGTFYTFEEGKDYEAEARRFEDHQHWGYLHHVLATWQRA